MQTVQQKHEVNDMCPKYLVFNAVMALICFFLNGALGKLLYDLPLELFEYSAFSFKPIGTPNFSGNFFFKIVNPTVYLALSSTIAQRLLPEGYVTSMWLFILAFWLIRFFFILLKNSLAFLNITYEIQAFLLSVCLGECVFFCIIKPLIADGEGLWISPSELRDALWVAILAYVAKTIWDMLKRQYTVENLYPASKRYEIAIKRYEKFNEKYGAYIKNAISCSQADKLDVERQSQIIHLLYAIMIYEDYNRPWAYRMAEYVVKVVFKRHSKMSLGIMQIRSTYLLSDLESIDFAINIVCKPFLEGDPEAISSAISLYNPGADYHNEVNALYEMLHIDPVKPAVAV